MTQIYINKTYPFLGFYTQRPVDARRDIAGNVIGDAVEGRKYRFAGGIFDIEDNVQALGLDADEKEFLERVLAKLAADPKSGVVTEDVALEARFECDFCKKPHTSKAGLYGHLKVHRSKAQIADESVAEGRNFKPVELPLGTAGVVPEGQ